MLKKILLLTFLLINACQVLAQTKPSIAPINWQRYKVSEQKISVIFPKLPVMIENNDYCREQASKNYAVYANGVVYGLNITTQVKNVIFSYCPNPPKFRETNFEYRLSELKKSMEETKYNLNGKEITKLTKDETNYWLINDYANKRWFEFWVIGANDDKNEVADFISSLRIKDTSPALEIGEGAPTTLGDETIENIQGKIGTTGLRIALKPRANYTDSARKNQVQGTVMLRVTFLSNGSIGSVKPVTELSDGLTEGGNKGGQKNSIHTSAKRRGLLQRDKTSSI